MSPLTSQSVDDSLESRALDKEGILDVLNDETDDKPKVEDEKEVLEQLFNISVALENATITEGDDLVTVVTFEDFGTEIISVSVAYTIFDEQEEQIFKDEDILFVETKKITKRNKGRKNLRHRYLS